MNNNKALIGIINEGLRKDVKSWATPEDSFEILTNAYQFRGRIVRRPGVTGLGRLANGTPVMGLRTQELFGLSQQRLIAFDPTNDYFFDNGTNTFVPLPSIANPVTWSGTDYQFFYTTNYAGAFWATNSKPGLHGVAISNITNAVTPTVTTSSNHGFITGQTVAFVNVSGMTEINGQTSVIIVTGLNTFTITINTTTYGAYSGGGIALNSTVSIPGQDGIRYYGTLTGGTDYWANYNPPLNTTTALAGALLIFPYRGYLVFLNTTEGNEQGVSNFGNRARWTQIGTPYYSLPVPTTPNQQTVDPKTARDDLFGRGGANDAPTQEVIIGAEFIRDILVVYFERSTWRLRFVNNAQNPFVWERVNRDLGCSSTFSTVAFDKGLMAISNRGIVISDANDTVRFDEKIPNDIFDIRQNNHGLQRVYGIRTFRTRLVYWTFPDEDFPERTYPDRVLVYNYETKNWSYFNDSFTCFGYYYPTTDVTAGFRWEDLTDPWYTYTETSQTSGNTGLGYETIVAGNQQGFVFKLEQTGSLNSPSLAISNIVGATVTSNNHNLSDGMWIKLSDVTGITLSDGVSMNNRNFRVANPTQDLNTFDLEEFTPATGGSAIGSTYSGTVDYLPILPGSVQINIGSLIFTDLSADGVLTSTGGEGSIDYNTGAIALTFDPPLGIATPVYIRVVSPDPEQQTTTIDTTGVYGGGGLITVIPNFDIQTKFFNFLGLDQRTRISKIDFYNLQTESGQFTCNIFSDSSKIPTNAPLPDNVQSNVVQTSPNAYQVSPGDETIYRLYCDVIAQTIQTQLTLSNPQMAVDAINGSGFELNAMIYSIRPGGRLL